MQAQLSLPSLSAGMPARSLSRTDFVKSAIDIEVQDTLVRDVDERRASSVMERQYPAAQSYYNTMLELKEVYEREERERELARQKEEGRKLQDAFVHLDHDLNTEWDERMHQFELKCEEMWKHLAERHAVAKEELNKSCEPLRRLKPKFSPELLDDEVGECAGQAASIQRVQRGETPCRNTQSGGARGLQPVYRDAHTVEIRAAGSCAGRGAQRDARTDTWDADDYSPEARSRDEKTEAAPHKQLTRHDTRPQT